MVLINEVVERGSIISRVESIIVKQELKFLEVAQMSSSSQFVQEGLLLIESLLGERLSREDRVLVSVMLQSKLGSSSPPGVSMFKDDRVQKLVLSLLQEQENLRLKKAQLGNDFPKYLRDRFQERLSLRLLEVQ